MIAQISIADVGAFGTVFITIIGVIYWTSKTKVNHNYCKVVRDANEKDHELIRGWIEDSEERAKERHTDLKSDLKEVKELLSERD